MKYLPKERVKNEHKENCLATLEVQRLVDPYEHMNMYYNNKLTNLS